MSFVPQCLVFFEVTCAAAWTRLNLVVLSPSKEDSGIFKPGLYGYIPQSINESHSPSGLVYIKYKHKAELFVYHNYTFKRSAFV